MNCKSLRDVEKSLYPYAERVPTANRDGWTTDRTRELAELVGSPHKRLRVVHVAGTSGKTTTSYYIAGLLHAANKKVGLTVSPHIAAINERVQIDGGLLDEDRFVRYFNEFMTIVEHSELRPTYFEVMMVFALWVFDKEGVDYAVVETGFGGRYDSSNICRRDDKVCVITDIGFDHMHILGDTMTAIASQKAGIIATGNIVCLYEQAAEVMQAIVREAEEQGATLRLAGDVHEDTYLERNFGLAQSVYEAVAERDKLSELSDAELPVVKSTHVPGRLERVVVEKTTFILDGAHNEQKMSALLNTLSHLYPDKKWPVVLSIKTDKNSVAMAELLEAHASEIVTSEFTHGQDMPSTPTPATELRELFQPAVVPIHVAPKLPAALEYYLRSDERTVLVTGSFYAIAEARAWLLEQKQGTIVT